MIIRLVLDRPDPGTEEVPPPEGPRRWNIIVAIFYPSSQFCEIDISLLGLQTQPNTAPNLFHRGVEYGKYEYGIGTPDPDPIRNCARRRPNGYLAQRTPSLSLAGSLSLPPHFFPVHPVSITRFPLRRFSPGAGLLRNRCFSLAVAKIFQGLGPKRRESSNGDRVYGIGTPDPDPIHLVDCCF